MDIVFVVSHFSLPYAKYEGERALNTVSFGWCNLDIWILFRLSGTEFITLDPILIEWAVSSNSSEAMIRRCSYCSHNGHNSRTCPNRGVKLFGVRLTDGSIRKSASMGNLNHYAGSSSGAHLNGTNNPGSPGDTPDYGMVPDGYTSDDFVTGSSSSCRERKKS